MPRAAVIFFVGAFIVSTIVVINIITSSFSLFLVTWKAEVVNNRWKEENDAATLVVGNYHNDHNDQQQHRLLTKKSLLSSFFTKSEIQLETVQYKLPYTIEHNLLDWYDYEHDEGRGGTTTDAAADDGNDVNSNSLPVFWHILKSGGTSIKLMYAQCYHLVEACEVGSLIDGTNNNDNNNVVAAATTSESAESQQLLDLEVEQHNRSSQSEIIDTSNLSPWEWMQQQLIQTSSPLTQQQQQQQEQNGNNSNNNERQRGLIEEQQQQQQQQQEQQQLRIVMSEDGRKYINVDVTTIEGIHSASQRGFASSTLPNVMFTPLLLDASHYLLSPQRKGRMFAIFRHPISRLTSIFYYLQLATWEPTYNPHYATMTIDDYASSDTCESNWMVRSLRNKMTGPLNVDDLHIAKEVLRHKCIIGLLERMEESVIRFHTYFKFDTPYEDALNCAIRNFGSKEGGGGGGSRGNGNNGKQNAGPSNNHPKLESNSETYKILEQKNMLDIKLYEYAEELFIEQGEWMKAKKMI